MCPLNKVFALKVSTVQRESQSQLLATQVNSALHTVQSMTRCALIAHEASIVQMPLDVRFVLQVTTASQNHPLLTQLAKLIPPYRLVVLPHLVITLKTVSRRKLSACKVSSKQTRNNRAVTNVSSANTAMKPL